MDIVIIRQVVFDEWRVKKSERLKEQLVSKFVEKKKFEEKEQEERERKKLVKFNKFCICNGIDNYFFVEFI